MWSVPHKQRCKGLHSGHELPVAVTFQFVIAASRANVPAARLSVLRELRAVTVELVVPLLSDKRHEGRYNGLIVRAEAVHVRRPH